jgi:plasmid stability protein
MASMTIRNLDDRVKEKIRVRAARQGRSMEEEARRLLTRAVETATNEDVGLGTAIRKRFASAGAFTLEPLPREPLRAPPKFK